MCLMVSIGIADGVNSQILYGTEEDVKRLQEEYPHATIKYSSRFGEIHNFVYSHVNDEMDKYRSTLRKLKKVSKVEIVKDYKSAHEID